MEPESLEAAAFLFALAIIRSPSQASEALRQYYMVGDLLGWVGGGPLVWVSPWCADEVSQLSSLFPWEGLSKSVEQGLFGSAVGRNSQGELCIQLYANSKGKGYLNDNVIPKFKPREKAPFSTVEVNSIRFAQRLRPCPGGVSVGALNGSQSGTLGGWLSENSLGVMGISNNHVVAEFNHFGQGHDVIQPSVPDGGGLGDQVAQLLGRIDLKNPGFNLVDLAWFRPIESNPNVVDHCIGHSGKKPKGEADLIQLYYRQPGLVNVWLCGRASGVVSGTVQGTRGSFFISDSAGNTYNFVNQLVLHMTTLAPGDSGGLVLTDSGDEIGGLLCAYSPLPPGSPGVLGYANPWQAVKAATNFNFSYP